MEDEMISAEEFFGELNEDKGPRQKVGKPKAKSGKDFFESLKVKMVMRIYGVSMDRAKKIIAGRKAEKDALMEEKASGKRTQTGKHDESDDEPLMSAEEFFGKL